jgi:hypothetical protein
VNALREGYFGRGTDPETPGFFDGAAMFDMVFVTVEPGKAATAVLELTPGAVISGIVRSPQGTPLADNKDIKIVRSRVIRISGRVIKDSGFPTAASASVQLLPRGRKWRIDHGGVLGGDMDGDGVLAWASATFENGNQGEFEFRGAFPQGSYQLRAIVNEGRREAAGSIMIDVDSDDIEGLSIVANAAIPR